MYGSYYGKIPFVEWPECNGLLYFACIRLLHASSLPLIVLTKVDIHVLQKNMDALTERGFKVSEDTSDLSGRTSLANGLHVLMSLKFGLFPL